MPTDVADYDQVKEASRRIEDAFGPIDVWINVAFTSVFAPFWEITAEEFKRVTEVSYLGFVYGTRVALDLMKPRDRGTIVQVGSALGDRSIPLQSAYCGPKHAINGFTSSLRTELMHEKSNVHITVVSPRPTDCRSPATVRSRRICTRPAQSTTSDTSSTSPTTPASTESSLTGSSTRSVACCAQTLHEAGSGLISSAPTPLPTRWRDDEQRRAKPDPVAELTGCQGGRFRLRHDVAGACCGERAMSDHETPPPRRGPPARPTPGCHGGRSRAEEV